MLTAELKKSRCFINVLLTIQPYLNSSMSIMDTFIHTDSGWDEIHKQILQSLSVSLTHSLSDSHIPSLHHLPIVNPLCEGRGIRGCVAELLSDVSAVQMDDPSTLP